MAEIDFGLLRTPDFAAGALGAYQAGAVLGKQKRVEQAMTSLDLTKPETILPILRADPATGATLLNASAAMAKAQHETAGRSALADYLTARSGNAGTPAAPQGDSMTALQRATGDYIRSDPEGYLAVQKQIGELDEAGQKRLADATDAFAVVGNTAKQLPYDQRKAYIQSQAGFLAAHGVTPDHLGGFDPTDFNINAELDKSLGTKEALARVSPRLFAGQPGDPVYDQNPQSPTYSMGGGSPAPVSGSGIPAAAIDHLRQNPALAQAFDQKYGAGASSQALGGASQAGARTFPLR